MSAGAFSARTRAAAYARDGDRCAGCGASGPLTLQHRRARGMGGTRAVAVESPANALTLCGSGTTGCHGWAEAHPVEATALGWRLAPGDDPELVPVCVRFYGVVRWEVLDAEGMSRWAEAPEWGREDFLPAPA